jgi:hypothetical protein
MAGDSDFSDFFKINYFQQLNLIIITIINNHIDNDYYHIIILWNI